MARQSGSDKVPDRTLRFKWPQKTGRACTLDFCSSSFESRARATNEIVLVSDLEAHPTFGLSLFAVLPRSEDSFSALDKEAAATPLRSQTEVVSASKAQHLGIGGPLWGSALTSEV
jgi:hypothetical protein